MASLIPPSLGALGTSALGALSSVAGNIMSVAARNPATTAAAATATGLFALYQSGFVGSACRRVGNTLVTNATDAAKTIAVHVAYKKLSDFISNAETETRLTQPEVIECRANGLSDLFAKNREFKALLDSPLSSQAAIESKFEELFALLKSAKFYVHGVAVNPTEQIPAPSMEEMEALHADAAHPEARELIDRTDETLNRNLQLELKKFTTCLRRKLEIQIILGDQATQNLNNTINGSSEEAFQAEFKNAIKLSITRSSTPAFLRKAKYAYIICLKFFLGLFTSGLLNKVNKFLDVTVKNFVDQDKTKIMDLITNILCSGLHLYTNEIINAAHELSTKTQVSGTPDQMFEDILSKKATLHKGMTQKDFYLYALDQILKYCFDWTITRWAVKQIVKASGFLNNPFLSLPQNIKHANGYFYNIDKSIVRFINPLIQQMATRRPGINPGAPIAAGAPERRFSNINKETLKKSIESLFEAADINKAANLSEIKKIVKRSDKSDREQGLLQSMGLDLDSILKQTAEAGATSLLENISDVLSSTFLKENAISALKSLNATFSSAEEITEAQYQAAERERKDSLNRLTRVIITNAVDSAPILNTNEVIQKLNIEITRSKAVAVDIKNRLRAFVNNADHAEVAAYPRELIDQSLAELRELKHNLDLAVDSGKYSDDQIQDIFAPYNLIKNYVARFQKNYQLPENLVPRHIDDIATDSVGIVDAFELAIDSDTFALRSNNSVMNNPRVKDITKFVLNFMLRQKFNQAYEFICDFKTIKYCVIHQGVLATL